MCANARGLRAGHWRHEIVCRSPRLQQGERVRGEITSSKGQEVSTSSKGKKQETRNKKQEAITSNKRQEARNKKPGSKKKKKKKKKTKKTKKKKKKSAVCEAFGN